MTSAIRTSPAERIAAAVYDISQALTDWCVEMDRSQRIGEGLPEAVAEILGCDVSDVAPLTELDGNRT